MWSRVVEIMIGCWLLMSPFLFRYGSDEPSLWINDFATGSAVIVFGLLSYWQPTRHIHLVTVAVGGWLIAFAYIIGFGTERPAAQNYVIVGLMLMMFAIIPNSASRPPKGWKATPSNG